MPNKKKKENRKKNVRVTTIDIQGTSLPLQNHLPVSSTPINSTEEARNSQPMGATPLPDGNLFAQVMASNRNPNVKNIIDTIAHDLGSASDPHDPTAFISAQLKAAGFHIGEKGNWVRNTTITKNSNSVTVEVSSKQKKQDELLVDKLVVESKKDPTNGTASTGTVTGGNGTGNGTGTGTGTGTGNGNAAAATNDTNDTTPSPSKNENHATETTKLSNSKSSAHQNTIMCHPTNSSYSRYNPSQDGNHNDNDEDNDDDDNDDDDDDDEDHVVGVCLHCGMSPPLSSSLMDLHTNLDQVIPCSTTTANRIQNGTEKNGKEEEHDDNIETAPGIQVSCDECHSFICTACHWCHEYQANHEIRVCDRCDGFYCKGCDEMDQCEDCGEVVCDGCGALCSCKFCGCGLCGDCATACGRCGIVLCARDAKFAVECDTCKMPYCLVCLASGTKDPCVRCGHRTSKRVEQLVHLRLKSIYKAFKQSSATSSNSSSASFAVKNNDQDALKGTSNKKSKEDIAVQVHKEGSGSVLQVAAAAAAAASALQTSANGSISAGKSNLPLTNEKGELNLPHGMNPARMGLTNSLFPPSSQKATKKNESDKFAAKTTAEADAAAAALLAELEEEMQNAEATTSAKKSKKKKKKEKERQLAKEKEDMAKKEAERKEAEKKETQKRAEEEKKKAAILAAEGDTKTQTNTTPAAKNEKNKKKEKSSDKSMELATSLQVITESPNDSDDDDSSHLAKSNMADLKEQDNLDDDTEMRLALAISANDLEGIESILLEMKGVPGRAALRKNAKKAVKKIKEEQEAAEAEQRVKDEKELAKSLHSALGDGTGNNSGVQYKPTDPLITTVSSTHRVQSSAGPARYERVMSMAPSVVGWVIGKGGQRIRDLMEESGAKVWIDQESMGPNDRRIVYVSGSKKSVETAVRTIKDLVNTAPTGSTTNPGSATVTTVASTGGVPNNLTVPEFEDIVSTRSSLTSTPISMANSSQHATMSSQKQFLSSPRRDLLHPPDNSTFLPNLNLPSAATPSSSHPRSISAPPGISSFLNQSSELHKVGEIRKNIVCEKRFVPLLIGRRGWTVKHIQDTSGARVDIDQNVNPPLIILSGAFEEVREAERQVQEILNYPHAQSNYGESGADNDVDIEPLSRNCLNSDPFKPNTRSPGEQESHLHNLRVAKTSDASPGFYNEGGFLKSHSTISQTVPQFDYTRGSSNASSLFDNTPLNPHSQHLQNNSFSLFDSNSPSLNRTTTGSAFGSLTPSSINHEHTFSRHPTSTMPTLQGSSQVTMNQYSEQHLPMHNFEYNDTILPLNANRSSHPSQYSGMTHNVSNSFIENDTMRTHPPGRQDQHEVFDDYNVVNNLFGSSLMDSQQSRNNESQNLLPSFNDLSLGNTGNSLTFDWDLLANATLEDGTPPRRSVGLGGVRLDNSHDFAGNNGK